MPDADIARLPCRRDADRSLRSLHADLLAGAVRAGFGAAPLHLHLGKRLPERIGNIEKLREAYISGLNRPKRAIILVPADD